MIAKRIAQALRKGGGPFTATYKDFEFDNGDVKNLVVSYYTPDYTFGTVESDTEPGNPIDLSPDEEQRITNFLKAQE